MAYNPFAGTAGAVRKSGAGVAGVKRWRFPMRAQPVEVSHFLSPANGDGVIVQQFIAGGLLTGEVEIEGIFDGDSTATDRVFVPGTIVAVDLLFSKTSLLGYHDMNVIVTELTPGSAFGNDPADFTMRGTITGAWAYAQTNATTTAIPTTAAPA